MNEKTKQVVVITGGNSGIGRGIAQAFAHQHAQLIVIGRNQASLAATAQALGRETVWLQADVGKRDDVAAVVEKIVEQFQRVDVLVNAAGFTQTVTTATPLAEAESLWDAVLDTNLKGSFLMSVAIAPFLSRPGGRIINMSSIGSFTGGSRAGALAYASSKAGLNGLTYALARELSSQGITVNAVAPGFVQGTGFTGAWPEQLVQDIVSQIPVGRAGETSDIAEAVLFLASAQASFITGEILNVNGGWLFGR
ncbi:MAG TPA: 3-oxoacyl-ACP reductase [Betaproteobacteria bacterium]|nr:3-oxoacyl-ACP reductase [Betaproteobacteria bacterium]